MPENYSLKRTQTEDKDFQFLVEMLDHELWNELKENQATYDQHNKVPAIKTAVLIYHNNMPVACGCFKPVKEATIEIKRMFVLKQHRGKGLSKRILAELELWAKEEGNTEAMLETSIHFETAIRLYQTSGYRTIANYGPYVGLTESICMAKSLV
jgi:putative acetyltransferase